MKNCQPFLRFVLVIIAALASPWIRAQQGSVTTPGADVLIKTGDTTTSTFRVFNAADTQLLRVTATGIAEFAGPVRSLPATGSFSVGGNAPGGYPFFAASATTGVATAMQLRSSYAALSTSYVGNFGTYGTYLSHNRDPQSGAFVDAAASPYQSNAVQLVVGDTQRSRLFQVSNYVSSVETVRVMVNYSGNMGIGTTAPTERLHVEGNIFVSGNINAKYQDIAEWVPASSDLAPGTVVVLDAALGNGVMASTTAYDTRVAGVVSAEPGIVLGEGDASKEKVATTGRVRVRVDASRAPIAVGDLLVTSDRQGYAMKSIPVDVAGIAMHRPGTIVGKALESLASGEGEVLVLLSLQ